MDKRVQTRQSNIELLRIISMLLIIGHHLSYYAGSIFDTSQVTVNRLWTQYLSYGGHVGVDVFVMISGYFMVTQKGLKVSRVVKYWLQLLTYSLVLYFVFSALLGNPFKGWEIRFNFMPVTRYQWTFASAFFLLMLASPFINKMLINMTKQQYRVVMAIFGVLWVVIPTISNLDAYSNYFTWLVYVYMLGAYVKLYEDDFTRSSKWYLLMSLLACGACFIFTTVCDFLAGLKDGFNDLATHFTGMQHLNIVVISVLLFIGFVKLDLKYNKCINYVASLVFGVYLIHDYYLVREYVWGNVIDNGKITTSPAYILITIGEIIAIFVTCAIIEAIRQLIEKFYMKGVTKMLGTTQKKLDKIFEVDK